MGVTGISNKGRSKSNRNKHDGHFMKWNIRMIEFLNSGKKKYSTVPLFHYSGLFILFFAILFSSCDKSRVYEKDVKIPKFEWDMNNPLTFEVPITDTISSYNMYFNIRNASGYSFSNLFLFFTVRAPDGKRERDTVEIKLADETGRWLGSGLGDIWDNKVLFKENFRFPVSGTYFFEMEQAMRVNPLLYIMDAGIRIEYAEKNRPR
jgi:gliding motility-associated lipoprotein GldH